MQGQRTVHVMGASYLDSLEVESSLLILGGLVCYLREYLFLWEESHRFLSPERAWEEQAESSAHSAFLWCRFGMRSPG